MFPTWTAAGRTMYKSWSLRAVPWRCINSIFMNSISQNRRCRIWRCVGDAGLADTMGFTESCSRKVIIPASYSGFKSQAETSYPGWGSEPLPCYFQRIWSAQICSDYNTNCMVQCLLLAMNSHAAVQEMYCLGTVKFNIMFKGTHPLTLPWVFLISVCYFFKTI